MSFLRSILNKGGIIYIETPNAYSLKVGITNYLEEFQLVVQVIYTKNGGKLSDLGIWGISVNILYKN